MESVCTITYQTLTQLRFCFRVHSGCRVTGWRSKTAPTNTLAGLTVWRLTFAVARVGNTPWLCVLRDLGVTYLGMMMMSAAPAQYAAAVWGAWCVVVLQRRRCAAVCGV